MLAWCDLAEWVGWRSAVGGAGRPASRRRKFTRFGGENGSGGPGPGDPADPFPEHRDAVAPEQAAAHIHGLATGSPRPLPIEVNNLKYHGARQGRNRGAPAGRRANRVETTRGSHRNHRAFTGAGEGEEANASGSQWGPNSSASDGAGVLCQATRRGSAVAGRRGGRDAGAEAMAASPLWNDAMKKGSPRRGQRRGEPRDGRSGPMDGGLNATVSKEGGRPSEGIGLLIQPVLPRRDPRGVHRTRGQGGGNRSPQVGVFTGAKHPCAYSPVQAAGQRCGVGENRDGQAPGIGESGETFQTAEQRRQLHAIAGGASRVADIDRLAQGVLNDGGPAARPTAPETGPVGGNDNGVHAHTSFG